MTINRLLGRRAGRSSPSPRTTNFLARVVTESTGRTAASPHNALIFMRRVAIVGRPQMLASRCLNVPTIVHLIYDGVRVVRDMDRDNYPSAWRVSHSSPFQSCGLLRETWLDNIGRYQLNHLQNWIPIEFHRAGCGSNLEGGEWVTGLDGETPRRPNSLPLERGGFQLTLINMDDSVSEMYRLRMSISAEMLRPERFRKR